jgi:hypothetical protein
MRNVSIGLRLAAGFGIMLAITLAVAATGYWGVESVADKTDEMLSGASRASQIAEEMAKHSLGLRRFEKDFLLSIGADAAEGEKAARNWSAEMELLKKSMEQLKPLIAHNDEDKREIAAMATDLVAYEGGMAKSWR